MYKSCQNCAILLYRNNISRASSENEYQNLESQIFDELSTFLLAYVCTSKTDFAANMFILQSVNHLSIFVGSLDDFHEEKTKSIVGKE